MPEPITVLLFALAALALIVVPGPNLVYIATRSLAEGRRGGVTSALGVETGTLVHVAAAALGLSALIASSTVAFSVLKYAGAAYLIFLGIKTLLGRTSKSGLATPAQGSLRRAYVEGVLVNVLNPKVALFFLAFLPQFVDPARGSATGQILVLGVVFFALALALDLVYALAASSLGARLTRRRGTPRRGRSFTGSVYLVLGAAAALSPGARKAG